MNDPRSPLIRYRLERARETWEEARVLAASSRRNGCTNRLYYSCFYTVDALLLQNQLSSSKHSGVRSVFNHHFVKTGIVSKSLARTYNDLYEKRQRGDYSDFTRYNEADVIPLIPEADRFISEISDLILKSNQ